MQHRSAPRDRSRNVLVLGTDSRVVLAVTRSLGRRGLQVHLGWTLPGCIATRSRYVAQVHDIPPYSAHDDTWKHAMVRLLRERPFELVIPCNDSTAVPLHLHRADFQTFPFVYLLASETFDIAFDKFKTYDLARSLGICVPKGEIISSASEAKRLLKTLATPVVLKPRATITAESVATSHVVRKAHNAREIRQLLRLPSFRKGVLVQENFAGRGVGVEILAHQGEVLTAFQHARIHETMEVGSSYRKSVPLHPELLDAARKLMKALNYTGVAMAEFIVNDQTGRWAFLEINGRFWGSLPLAVAAGADFPYYLYQMLVEGVRKFPQDYRTGVYCRNLVLDYRGRKQWLRACGDSKPRMLARTAWEILTRDHLDSFAPDDMMPGLMELAQFAGTILAKARGKLRLPRFSPGIFSASRYSSRSA